MRVELPPVIVGVPQARPRHAFQLVWWTGLGWWHGARKTTSTARAYGLLLALMWWPTWPLLVIVQLRMLTRANVRYYLAPTRDAALAVTARSDGWHFSDHVSAHPGTGQGDALRRLIMPTLMRAADDQGINIHLIAASSGLAERYARDIPGFVDAGPARPRGRRLYRRGGGL